MVHHPALHHWRTLWLKARIHRRQVHGQARDELASLAANAQVLLLVGGLLVVAVLASVVWSLAVWYRAGTGWGALGLVGAATVAGLWWRYQARGLVWEVTLPMPAWADLAFPFVLGATLGRSLAIVMLIAAGWACWEDVSAALWIVLRLGMLLAAVVVLFASLLGRSAVRPLIVLALVAGTMAPGAPSMVGVGMLIATAVAACPWPAGAARGSALRMPMPLLLWRDVLAARPSATLLRLLAGGLLAAGAALPVESPVLQTLLPLLAAALGSWAFAGVAADADAWREARSALIGALPIPRWRWTVLAMAVPLAATLAVALAFGAVALARGIPPGPLLIVLAGIPPLAVLQVHGVRSHTNGALVGILAWIVVIAVEGRIVKSLL